MFFGKIPFFAMVLGLTTGSLTAFAGPGASGGGNALVCFDDPAIPIAIHAAKLKDDGTIKDEYLPRITSVEMLDLFQARLSAHPEESGSALIAVEPTKPGLSYTNKPVSDAEGILRRLEDVAPSVRASIRQGADALSGNVNYLESPVAQIDDIRLLYKYDESRCVVATLAAQDVANNSLFIDNRLFAHPKHSELSRATLFLHEWVYQRLLHLPQPPRDSAGVRVLLAPLLRVDSDSASNLVATATRIGLISAPHEQLNSFELAFQKQWSFTRRDLRFQSQYSWGVEHSDWAVNPYGQFGDYKKIRDGLKALNLDYCRSLKLCQIVLSDRMVGDPGEGHELKKDLLKKIQDFSQKVTFGAKLYQDRIADGRWTDYLRAGHTFQAYPWDESSIETFQSQFVEIVKPTFDALDEKILDRLRVDYPSYEAYNADLVQLRDEILDQTEARINIWRFKMYLSDVPSQY